MGTMKLSGGAGGYTGEVAGYRVDVLFETTVYGDKGWNAYLSLPNGASDGIVTDYPCRTRTEAVAVALASIKSRQEGR
jgi:hypothetical protein